MRTRHRSMLTSALILGALGSTFLGAGGASASSHREAPAIAGTPRLDTTDVYAFNSPDKRGTVTLLANWLPFSEPAGGPNFYTFEDGAWYDIAVDTNGDAKPNIVYRWVFKTRTKNPNTFLYNTGPVTSLTDPDLNVVQTYDLQVFKNNKWSTLKRNLIAAPSHAGRASMPDYPTLRRQATYNVGGGIDTFAGQADDPFFLDLRVFDLLYGGDLSEVGNDTLRGYNVNTTAIRVPASELGGAKNTIGVWSRTWKKGANGQYTQVSRLGMPLVNEVVIPLKDKDKFNASKPSDDAQFLKYVTNPGLPKVVEQVYGIKAPKEPRNDLVQVFLTGVPGLNQPAKVTPSEMIRLNLTPFAGQKPSSLGVIGGDRNGYPNGRRLADDVLDISLQVVEGELVGSPNDLSDKVDRNDVAFGPKFPYIGLPTSGSMAVNSGSGASSSSSAPSAAGADAGTPAQPDAAQSGAGQDAGTPAEDPDSPVPAAGLGAVAGLGFLGAGGGWWLMHRRRRHAGAPGAPGSAPSAPSTGLPGDLA
jgi:hypothetical protein